MNTDLVIVGGGAAGLMAGVTAGELGLRAVIVERKHQPGRKLLMCGNNRCNVTNRLEGDALIAAYGDPSGPFLKPALAAFPPTALRAWFRRWRLETVLHKDGRVFPKSERADDVLHCFTDALRELGVPMVLNCPVTAVRAEPGGFMVETERMRLRSPQILIATGGVTYPKTGSVGDGQRFARDLGHKVLPYRPGLAGLELNEPWLTAHADQVFAATACRVWCGETLLGETCGEILLTRWGARGPAMVDATRLIGRAQCREFAVEVDLLPGLAPEEAARRFREVARKGRGRIADGACLLAPPPLAEPLCRHVLGLDPRAAAAGCDPADLTAGLAGAKRWRPVCGKPRPLKEAMVTVGGVCLDEVCPETLGSRRCPGLAFAGEVLDVDGPTGGFNLQAAFSTARLAVTRIAAALGCTARVEPSSPSRGRSRRSGRSRKAR